jgi:hypothetical protein
MIHPSLIDSARRIKLDYEKTERELNQYITEVAKLAEDFTKSSEQVGSLAVDIKKKKLPADKVKNELLQVLIGLEDKYKLLLDKINKINQDLEKLKTQENDLYQIIKSRYPSLTDDQIKQEVLEKVNG